uniref:(northern house mosquito) hypothetical protein n=1 Tax=Culex pipiens TaxID=7175 RepID=A0A8D8B3W3_CULPI
MVHGNHQHRRHPGAGERNGRIAVLSGVFTFVHQHQVPHFDLGTAAHPNSPHRVQLHPGHRGRFGDRRRADLLRPAGNVDVQAGRGLVLVRDIQQFWRHVRHYGWPLADKHFGKCLLRAQTVCVGRAGPVRGRTVVGEPATGTPPTEARPDHAGMRGTSGRIWQRRFG